MQTPLNIDDELLALARELTGETAESRLVHRGLELLIQRVVAERLEDLGGTEPQAVAGPRRRPAKQS